ncbi:hypothetical protein FB451DRAFT_1366966 [Mycena latifolia]|nr:hypothetical protein FB451DRAFT_1366966 [Mycena latifolia]
MSVRRESGTSKQRRVSRAVRRGTRRTSKRRRYIRVGRKHKVADKEEATKSNGDEARLGRSRGGDGSSAWLGVRGWGAGEGQRGASARAPTPHLSSPLSPPRISPVLAAPPRGRTAAPAVTVMRRRRPRAAHTRTRAAVLPLVRRVRSGGVRFRLNSSEKDSERGAEGKRKQKRGDPGREGARRQAQSKSMGWGWGRDPETGIGTALRGGRNASAGRCRAWSAFARGEMEVRAGDMARKAERERTGLSGTREREKCPHPCAQRERAALVWGRACARRGRICRITNPPMATHP